ncbi:MAG TPA: ABC transporter substrate-binding protein [Acidimicrobiales bacterium]|nr:ABC transporter substrate-binding protein [Acidimicrobiales bacterium]
MTRPGSGPGLPRRALVAALVVAVLTGGGLVGAVVSAGPQRPAASAATTTGTTTTTNPWVPGTGGTVIVGIDQAPTGCNPNTASGDTWADRLLLEPVLPSAFTVNTNDQPVYDPALITQAELQSTTPETVVYTINPRAVWSDGKPVTAADFEYTWRAERGMGGPVGVPAKSGSSGTAAKSKVGDAPPTTVPTTPVVTTPVVTTTLPGATGTTGPELGYRQITSVTPSANGRSVTVVFKTPYADWQSLFDDLLPAHVLQRTGWDPHCTTLDPAIDLSAGPFVLRKVVPGKEVVLVRNAKWWEQLPAVAKIVVRIASGPAELSQWLASGEVDVALPTGYDQHYLQSVTSQPALVSQSQISTTLLQLEFSTTAPYTANVDVRLAIAHAVDRQALVNGVVGWADSTIVPAASHLVTQGQQGYPAHRPPPLQVSGQPGYTKSPSKSTSPTTPAFPPGADLAASTRLLTAAGALRLGAAPWQFPTGTVLAFSLAVDTADPWAEASAPMIVRQLEAAGIAVTLVDAASAQATGLDLASGHADMALLPIHSGSYPSQAISWYTPLLGTPGTGGSQDWSNFDDTSLNALLEKASQELNPVDAAPLYTHADAALWQQMVALPLFAQPTLFAWSGLVAGVNANADGPSLMWTAQDWAVRVPPDSPSAQK